MLKKILSCTIAIGFVVFFISGCQMDISAPRPRMGSLPTSTAGIVFLNPTKLGSHSYYFTPFEQNGIVYTCKAGHIDIAHVRWNADYTRYLTKKTRNAILKKKKGFSFNLALEISTHKVRFTYPEDWDSLPQQEKERIADEVAIETGAYLAFNATLWHEILTWFGVHFVGFEPEFNSAFSWEDTYSNLIGTELGVEALQDPNNKYDKALALAIDRRLEELGVQPKKVAKHAAEKMRGQWFKSGFSVTTMKKNVDIGLDDGQVTPTLSPDICDSAEPEIRPVPNLDALFRHNFSVKYTIRPHEFEKGRILKAAYQNEKKRGKVVRPVEHFPVLMDYIKKQAVEKYNYTIE